MQEMPFKLDYSEESSQETDYGDDPHVYGSKWEFIMSAVGVCVGFGSFWRFPYLVYKNGGGAFLIPYLIAMILLGMPLLYLETSIGQMFRKSIPYALVPARSNVSTFATGNAGMAKSSPRFWVNLTSKNFQEGLAFGP